MERSRSKHPCIGVCRFDADDRCTGCFLTRIERKRWKALPEEARAAIALRIGVCAKPGGKRLGKLDKKIRKLEKKLERLRAERAGLGVAPSPILHAVGGDD